MLAALKDNLIFWFQYEYQSIRISRQLDILISVDTLEVFNTLLESQVCLRGTSSVMQRWPRPHLGSLDYRNRVTKVGQCSAGAEGQYFCLIASFVISQMKPDHGLQPGISEG